MALNYGRPPQPEPFIIAALASLNRPAFAEREQITGFPPTSADDPTDLPCYLITSVANVSDRHILTATVSVHSMALSRAHAKDIAWDADNHLLSLTPGDEFTLPNGITAGAWVCPHSSPTYQDYRDPFIKRYVGRYTALLRFTGVDAANL
jgi:hypothetical protein